MTALLRRARAACRHRRTLAASWRRLSWTERGEFVVFAVLIPIITLSLHLLGFRRTQVLLAAWSRNRTSAPGQARDAAVRALQRACRYAPYRGNCLPQSLALWFDMRRRGRAAELCLGVRLRDGRLAAHAWVEDNGRPLNDTPTVRRRFSAFESPASSRAAN